MLEWTGERYLPDVDPAICGAEIHYEHLHRYAFASQFVKGKKVLDLACGEGYGSIFLSKIAQSVVGIDINPQTIQHASHKYSKDNVQFKEGSILDIPIPGTKIFDVIICFEAIEHITEHEILIDEVVRLLKDDGILIISTPNKKIYSDESNYHNPFHEKELYFDEFDDLLKKYFLNVNIFGQRTITGSNIFSISANEFQTCTEFVIDRVNDKFIFKNPEKKIPIYYIAIASKEKLNDPFITKSFLTDISNAKIAILSNQIVQNNVTILSLQQRVIVEKQQFQDSTNQVLRLNQTIADKDSQLLDRTDQVSKLNQTIADKDLQLLDRTDQVSRLNQTIADKDLQLLDRTDQVSRLNQIIADKDSQLLDRTNQVSKLNQIIADKDSQLLDRTNQVSKLNQIIADKDSQLLELSSQFHNQEQKLSSIEKSMVWQLTMKFHTKVIERLLPYTSRRRKYYDLALKCGRIFIDEGFKKMYAELKTNQDSNNNLFLPENNESQKAFETNNLVLERKMDSPHSNPHLQKKTEYVPLSNTHINLIDDDIKCIAFYLPQFHPINENDKWWGKGFTEWTNVTKALPQFEGHYQPHFPDELGYYDLRLIEVQKRQIELAKQYGIYGFCFHYYWFNGKRLLERPLNQFLDNRELDFPFCVCWANENWTRRWDGLENDILIAQDHSSENDIRFIHDVYPILCDPRYIRIDNKPLIIVYRASLLPEPDKTVIRWREYCREAGIGEIYIIAVQSFGFEDPRIFGFDASVEFPPHNMPSLDITDKKHFINSKFNGTIRDYEYFVKSKKYLNTVPYTLFKAICPGWDNTARRQNDALIYDNSRPDVYKEWLSDIVTFTKNYHPPSERIIFINAWNEWAEGAHLEPDKKYGYAFLQVTSEIILKYREELLKNKETDN